jgi:hypothetical protein
VRGGSNGGSQFVRVEHVHVNEGGQAVIGPVAVDRTQSVARADEVISQPETEHTQP